MSKAVHWQIPFKSIGGTSYRIDIYDEGYTGQPVQLTGGSQPFVTNESEDEDFFAPVRTQSGNIQICTKMPNGNMIRLDDILPENNIARPVRLINLSNSNAIEWMGFLSCEAYSQQYTSIPQILSLPVISVLEAMRSMYIDEDSIELLGTVGCMLSKMMDAITFNRYSNVYIPKSSWDIFNKKINSGLFLSKDEFVNGESVIYKLTNVSPYDFIFELCNYMGWTAREAGSNLYFQLAQGNGDSYYINVATLIAEEGIDSDYLVAANAVTKAMSQLTWRGDNHTRSIRQGAHSVHVSAQLKKFTLEMNIPVLTFGDLYLEKYHTIGFYEIYMLASTDDDAYSNLTFKSYTANIQIGTSSVSVGTYNNSYTDLVVEFSIPYARTFSPAYETYDDPTNAYLNYAGAFLARAEFNNGDPDPSHLDTNDGLMISLFGGVWQEHTVYNKPIFTMKSVQPLVIWESGYLHISAQALAFWNDVFIGMPDDQTKLLIDLRVGNKVWTGSQWVNQNQHTEHFFVGFEYNTGDKFAQFESNWDPTMGIDEVSGLLIPIDSSVIGEIVLTIYPETKKRVATSDSWRRMVYGMFFAELNVNYIPINNVYLTDRGSNEYYKELTTNFRDDIEKQVNLASWLHNVPSPSLLYDDNNTPMNTIDYVENGQTKSKQPEIDLLNRLASYYGAARQLLSLEVKHPTDAPLPLLRLNGINDGKKYLPLAESRDWAEDKSTLTCFETVNA